MAGSMIRQFSQSIFNFMKVIIVIKLNLQPKSIFRCNVSFHLNLQRFLAKQRKIKQVMKSFNKFLQNLPLKMQDKQQNQSQMALYSNFNLLSDQFMEQHYLFDFINMNPPHFVSFFQKITRKLAQTFQELNQLCLQEINNYQRQSSKSQQLPRPQQVLIQPVIQTPIEIDSSEEVPNKDTTKTKHIKKQSVANEVQKQGDQIKSKKKVKKTSHKPKAPASSFLMFFKDQQNNMAQTYPNYGVTQLTKVAAKLWKEISKEQKEPYIKLCDNERRLYQQKMEKYRIQFPHQIAEKEKDRKLMRKQKKNAGKDTPKKQKSESQLKITGSFPQQDLFKVGQNPRQVIEEEIIDSEQFMKEELSDSLGMM